ncbi:MAG TPA: hypothetical protein ENJ00_03480 [Phycisphaerales bacterium]|nr:hypothetical protein [Phycisphaerales bacterium]
MSTTGKTFFLITADAVCDASLSVVGDSLHPAALLIERSAQDQRILAVGPIAEVGSHPLARSAKRIDRPGEVLLPAFVNAHTHLDLSHIGPRPHSPADGFVSWVDFIREHRHQDEAGIRDAVNLGCDLLRRGGVAAVGDIAGAPMGRPSLVPWQTLSKSGLAGVSFLEFFAIGTTEKQRLETLRSMVDALDATVLGRTRLGLQPHAPNTVSPRAYAYAGELAEQHHLPLMTHLAESIEERLFVAEGIGPQVQLVENLGIWSAEAAADFGHGLSPVQHLGRVLQRYPFTAVHVNQCSDDDLDLLERTTTRLVYCPRASAYFGADLHFGPHRYRDMLDRGLTVALGTDSVVNLPPDDVERSGLSTLDEARFLYERDHTDPTTLLAMATVHGADTLGMDRSHFSLGVGDSPLAVVSIPVKQEPTDPLVRVLESRASPQFLLDTGNTDS